MIASNFTNFFINFTVRILEWRDLLKINWVTPTTNTDDYIIELSKQCYDDDDDKDESDIMHPTT